MDDLNPMVFKNRDEAARLLSKKLTKYKNQNALVLGIPRGAMPMAKIISNDLNGELGAILVHKIPAPFQEELAIGSVGLSGKVYRLPIIEAYEVSDSYIERETKRQLEVLKKRQAQFHLPEYNYQNRIVIIVDDGIATGATAIGAIHELRAHKPKKLILAAAVVAKSTADTLRHLVDEFIVLEEPSFFYAVSQFFIDFTQVSDEEVIKILRDTQHKTAGPADLHP